MTEFTATLAVKIEITINAKNREEALSFLDDLYANITIENDGNREIAIISDNLYSIENDWILED